MGDPKTLPRPNGGLWFMVPEIKATASSGKVVAIETKVTPMINWETPRRLANEILAFPTQSAPLIAARRATMKMIISGINFIITLSDLKIEAFSGIIRLVQR